MTTWQFGGKAPVFNGPDLSPLNILAGATGSVNIGNLFTLDVGTKSYTTTGDTPVGVSFSTSTGVYSWAGAVTIGVYAMITRCTGSDGSYTEYSWTLNVATSAGGNPPVLVGSIDNQSQQGDFTFDASPFATGQTSYSVSSTPAGISFNTGTGLFTVVAATSGAGIFGPFTVTYTNATGSVSQNPFTLTVLIANTPGDYTDATLQTLLDPGNNFTGIRLMQRHQPASLAVVCYYVVPIQRNKGYSRWVECLATDTAGARANKIIAATTIPAQPTWPLAMS